jgi:hypothetical protein
MKTFKMNPIYRKILHQSVMSGSICYIFISKDRSSINFSLFPKFFDDDLAFIIRPKNKRDEKVCKHPFRERGRCEDCGEGGFEYE